MARLFLILYIYIFLGSRTFLSRLAFLKFYIVTLIPIKNHECRRICEANRKNYGISMNKRVK